MSRPSSGVVSDRSGASTPRNQWNEWTQQLTAYTSWVNSQLRKREGQREVTNLREDVRDGVVLCDLVEIVSGESLSGVHRDPSSTTERRENVDRVLNYMRTKRIRMASINAKDVTDGNAKSVMRLILALAAHFKPNSVKQQSSHRSTGNGAPHRGAARVQRASSTLAAAQDAAAALASIRRDAASVGQKLTQFNGGGSLSSSLTDAYRRKGSSGSLEQLGWKAPSSALSSRQSSLGEPHAFFSPGSSTRSRSSQDSSSEGEGEMLWRRSHADELAMRQDEACRESRKVKAALLRLQRLLLKDSQTPLVISEIPADDGSSQKGVESEEGSEVSLSSAEDLELPVHDRLVISQSRLQQLSGVLSRMKEELSRTKQECMLLEGKKEGLQARLTQQEEQLQRANTKLVQRDLEVASQQSEKDRVEILESKAEAVDGLELALKHKENSITSMVSQLGKLKQKNEELTQQLEKQTNSLQELQIQQQTVSTTTVSLTNGRKTPANDSSSESSVKVLPSSTTTPINSIIKELTDLESALSQHNMSSSRHNPTDHTDKTRSLGLDRISYANGTADPSNSDSHITPLAERLVKKIREVFRFNSTSVISAPLSPGNPGPISVTVRSTRKGIKALCYSPKSLTPSMKTLPGQLGDLTLADFKKAFNIDSPNMRYQFKSLDPEFGEVVKLEVSSDEEIIPGWEGKVTAWIEEVFIR